MSWVNKRRAERASFVGNYKPIYRQNIREAGTMDQMAHVVAGCVGQRLLYQDLVGAG